MVLLARRSGLVGCGALVADFRQCLGFGLFDGAKIRVDLREWLWRLRL
jgi:hypothetical protein